MARPIRFHLVWYEELNGFGDVAGTPGAEGQLMEMQPVARISILRGSDTGDEYFDFETLDGDGHG
jgi:hypothetical protein